MDSSMSPSLSDLPDGVVVDEILVRLPLREAVRTSVLSRAWRHRWHSIPELLFEDRGIPPAAAIDNVLLLHSAPVRRFSLAIYHSDHANRWILSLSRRGAGHLLSLDTSDFHFQDPFPLPHPLHSSVFSFRETLTDLNLAYCSLSLPPHPLCSFPALRSLQLQLVKFPDDRQLSVLISGCPALEHLSLKNVWPCGSLSLSCRASGHLLSLDLDLSFLIEDDLYPLHPLHPSVFSFCETLTHLHLANCFLSLPPHSHPWSFPALRSLQLDHIEFPDDHRQLSVLISGCPALEHLSLLLAMWPCGRLRVHSPNLRSFELCAYCDRVELMSGQTLHYLSIKLDSKETDVELAELFRGVVCEDELCLQHCTIEALAKGSIPESMVTSFQRLRSLSMTVSLVDPRQISVMLCLMRSAPNLQRLVLVGPYCNGPKYADDETGPGVDFWMAIQSLELFASLRTMDMENIQVQEPDMEFMRFILARAQVLETLTISSPETISVHESALTELRKFHRTSSRVQIIYKEQEEDETED